MILDIKDYLPWIIVLGIVIVLCIIGLIVIIASNKKDNKKAKDFDVEIKDSSKPNEPDEAKAPAEEVKEDEAPKEKKTTKAVKETKTTKKTSKKSAPEKTETKKEKAPKPKAQPKAQEKTPKAQEEAEDLAEIKTANQKYMVVYDKENKNWIIKKTGAKKASKRCKTKKEALEIAERLADNQDLNLSIKKKDGKFQKKY